MAVGSGACLKMWLTVDMEVAELGPRRLCRRGIRASKGGGNEPLVCQVPGEVWR